MDSPNQETADLEFVMEVAGGFWRSRALFSGVELGLFTMLATGPATLDEITGKLGLHARAAADFLDALTALGLLEHRDGRYANAPAAARLLDQNGEAYVGGFLTFMARALYPAWGRLTDLLKSGSLQEGDDSFGEFYRDLDRVRGFMNAMDSASAVVTAYLVEQVDWSGHQDVVDLGGARGNLAGSLARAHAHLRTACFDMPPLRPLFDEHMATLGTTGRTKFHGGDFLTDALPEADAYIFGHVLHDWDEKHRAMLVTRAFETLRPGGELLVYDELIDDDRAGPAHSLLMSINMKLVRSGGAEYTFADAKHWLGDAGYTDVTVERITATERLIRARKPAAS